MICSFLRISSFDQAASFLDTLALRNSPSATDESNQGVEAQVKDILHNVQTKGLAALIEYTQRFDAPHFSGLDFAVPPTALSDAFANLEAKTLAILQEAIANITDFHQQQRQQSWFTTRPDGSVFGQRVSPVDRAGLYVPAGQGASTPLISSLLMSAIPALVAGVKEIAVISPPDQKGQVNPVILAVAHMLGIKEVYAAGSAWAIAALAYGAGALAPVDVIAGPGNIFVATAKRLLIGQVGIDMIAGPSEILVIAGPEANPLWIAADMISQAEHDPLASAICLCTSESVASAVHDELSRQVASLPRSGIATRSLEKYGAIMVVPNFDVAVEIANAIAPEHLQLLIDNPWEIMPALRHAGAIFMGHYASEVLGDYFAGPNHVLPTMGTARFSSALGVETFCKKTSLLAPSREFAQASARSVAALARLEALEGHAMAALCREKK